MRKLLLTVMLSLFLGLNSQLWGDTLWLGTDNTNTRPILNTDLVGNVLRQIPTEEASGIAVDLSGNTLYTSNSAGTITSRNLTTLGITGTITPLTNFSEDMAFDGTSLWRADYGFGLISKIDPATGNILFSFTPGSSPLGVAWDGTDLWVSDFTYGGMVRQFTTAGVATGNFFNAPTNVLAGGLAYDSNDGTMFLGTWANVYHVKLDGTVLGSFTVADGRFVDGLEFQSAAATPEPSSLILLGFGLAGFAGVIRRKLNR